MITWSPTDLRLRDIADGVYDSTLEAQAKRLRQFGTPLFLRFAHEMNGTWYTWGSQHPQAAALGNTPDRYIAAWRHVHSVFKSAGVRNVSWVWCPNAVDVPGDNDLRSYYPGDRFVDWLGLDVYSSDLVVREAPTPRSFSGLVASAAGRLPGNLPLIVAEFGFSGSAAHRRSQFASVPRVVRTNPRLRGLVYFDRASFSPATTPSVLAAARAMGASMALTGRPERSA